KKRKNRDVVEKYHREEKEVEVDDEEQVQPKKPNLQKEEPTPIITEENKNNELIGIPIAPPTQKNSEKPGVIFILENASLEIAKIGK
ncbi:ribosomal RNA small subunit methyltransferase NEP1-like protein, partial [Trifolium pratense]